jgi:hypothetical protein
MMPSVDRTAITSQLVSRLVGAQFPQWAGLPVRQVEPGGWDNITFRLGPDMSVRLPSGPGRRCDSMGMQSPARGDDRRPGVSDREPVGSPRGRSP